jgi:hypothetical protein
MDGTGSSPLLGTPTARDWKGEGFEGRPLAEVLALTLLPTPTAADGTKVARNKTSGRKPDSKHHTGTTMQDVAYEWAVKLLPTPLANPTERTPERHAEKRAEMPADLRAVVTLRSSGASTSPPSDDGKPSTAQRPRLSPEFVEWMMGTPRCNECGRGWTDSACPHSATAFTSTSAGSSGTRS